MARLAAVALASVATLLGGAVLMYFVAQATAELWRAELGRPQPKLPVYLVLLLGAPIAAAALVARVCGARILDGSTRGQVRQLWRWACWPVVCGYVLTGAFGCPAVHNALVNRMIAARAEHGLISSRCVPFLATYVAVPLIPGLVLSYVEGGDSCEAAAGSFLLHFWNGVQVTRLGTFAVWGGP
jgi:hypothetical protein